MHYLETGLINSKKKYFIVHHGIGLGWHFLDWTIKYLSGNQKNFFFREQKYLELLSNPIGITQAHKHKITFVYSKEQLIEYNSIAETVDNNYSTVVLQNGIATNTINGKTGVKENLVNLSTDERLQLSQLVTNGIVELTKLAVELGFTVISIYPSKEHVLIPAYQTRQGYNFNTGEVLNGNEDINELWIETFFSDSKNKFNNEVWDKREQLALTMRPMSQIAAAAATTNKIIEIPGVISFNTKDFWTNGCNLFDSSNKDKQNHWNNIYNQWRTLHDTNLSKDYWTILDCIVNNIPMDLSCYNLNLAKEAFIQHGLIYKYNLNLKNWNLARFPNNTIDLHLLLEENFHDIDKDYCKNF